MNNKAYRFTLFLLFAYFLIRLLFFAVSINPYVPPDEIDHLGISQYYSHSLLLPVDSSASYKFGPITNKPPLYYFLMGKLLKLNVFPMQDLLFLRLINILLGLLTVVLAFKIIQSLTSNKLTHLLLLILMTNTPMFSFLCASINYDNLVNLLAAWAIYTLLRFRTEQSLNQLLTLGIIILLGIYTKLSFIPLAIVLAILAVQARLAWNLNPSEITLNSSALRASPLIRGENTSDMHSSPLIRGEHKGGSHSSPSEHKGGSHLRLRYPLLFILTTLTLLNIQLYGHNLITYKNINPGCNQILTTAQCMEWRIFARGTIVTEYREGIISKPEAQAMALKISHPADQRDTLFLIEITKPRQQHETVSRAKLNRWQYSISWTKQMVTKLSGVMGHLAMAKQGLELIPYLAIVLTATFLFVVEFIRRKLAINKLILFSIFLMYTLVLMQFQNFSNYSHSGFLELAIQIRYLFPVIVPLYLLFTTSLLSITNKWWQWFVLAGATLVFIWGDFPFFLSHATKGWYFQ